MKKLLLAIIFAASIGEVSAQNEYLQNNPEWVVLHVNGIGYPCIAYDSMHYYLNGDTLINSLLYKQIWKCGHVQNSWQSPNPNPGCGGQMSYCDTIPTGFVRSQGLQMYYIPGGDTSEQLLYDFNLSVGSALPICYTYCCPFSDTVTSIDSIYTPYGYRKRFFINNNLNDYLVEGIGSRYGFLEPYGIQLDHSYDLLCYALNDTAWFPSQGPACDVMTTLPVQAQQEISFQLVPNPASEYVDVKFSGQPIDLIEVYDVTGQKMKSQTATRIGTVEFAGGIYFVRVISGGNVITQKLLIE